MGGREESDGEKKRKKRENRKKASKGIKR